MTWMAESGCGSVMYCAVMFLSSSAILPQFQISTRANTAAYTLPRMLAICRAGRQRFALAADHALCCKLAAKLPSTPTASRPDRLSVNDVLVTAPLQSFSFWQF